MTDYENMMKKAKALFNENDYGITTLANASALLNEYLDNINWVGFYLTNEHGLALGPFQGGIACTNIAPGKGVCGKAVEMDKTILVPNVHDFPGHIACDATTNSEIVIPIHKNNAIYAVLDIDSKMLNRFSALDQSYLEKFCHFLEQILA